MIENGANVDVTMTGNTLISGAAPNGREQDRLMPVANVIRMMRKVLPSSAKIADDAKETIQECVSEFISFVTSEANYRCQREQRRTITAEDLMWAMCKLGFDNYIHPLSIYLQRFREIEGGDHRSSSKREFLPILKKDPQVAACPIRPSQGVNMMDIYAKSVCDAHMIEEYPQSITSMSMTPQLDPFSHHQI
ncbi:hypothetical protein KP509_08G068900 [Ceratopteris richardii]|nr:hypothetical protein KP509_08G068900 [Ceratopteris richardii]